MFKDKLQLTYPQYLVLVTLWEKPQRTIKELGEVLNLDNWYTFFTTQTYGNCGSHRASP
ncbi:MarR family transcriptional regulator [Bacillus sp. FJAT-22090]|uniref:MarR family transcriptional regulator n=1 Tax=Bacillus sp. FJAT-22090 TaxID=1581038 RepID=UPI0037BE31E0